MGEEAKQEQAKAEAQPEQKSEEKKEEKTEEKKEEKPEEKKEEPKPPSPFVLYVDLHCVGCAKKIEKSIMRIRGVEGVEVDMAKNEVTIKGIVEPQAVCMKIMKKTKRSAKVLSPLPASEGAPIPDVVTSQVSGLITVELIVDMHCEACAEQLKRKILRMRGVQTAETELSTGKVMVTGTMEAEKLVDYVYRRTKKQARIVPQPAPEPEPEKKEENKEAEKPAEEAKPEEKTAEEEAAKKVEKAGDEESKELEAKKEGGGELEESSKVNVVVDHEEGMKRMMYHYEPLYVIERIPPPQLFSDENPNACCIS